MTPYNPVILWGRRGFTPTLRVYLQYCFCENPRGRLQLIDFLYFRVHFISRVYKKEVVEDIRFLWIVAYPVKLKGTPLRPHNCNNGVVGACPYRYNNFCISSSKSSSCGCRIVL